MKTQKNEVKQITIEEIAISKIVASKFNPRNSFPEDTLVELAKSIQEQGLLSPIKVRPLANGKFEIVYGERRYRAAKLNKSKTISAIVEELSDEQAEDAALTENLMREDISPLEECRAFNRKLEMGYDVKTLSVHFGKSLPYIYSRIKLNNVIPAFEELFANNEINIGFLNEIANLSVLTQENLFENHFAGDYNDWRKLSNKEFAKSVNRYYSCKISEYKYLLETCCKECPHNSMTASLFVDEKQAACFNLECFKEKLTDYLACLALKLKKENPSMKIELCAVNPTETSPSIEERIQEQGYDVVVGYPYEIEMPEEPEVPVREEFESDEDFEEAKTDYEEFKTDYDCELEQFNQSIENGEISQRIFITRCEVTIQYAKVLNVEADPQDEPDSEEYNGDNKKMPHSALNNSDKIVKALEAEKESFNSKIKRERELRLEKMAEDFKEILPSIALITDELSDMETKLFYCFLLNNVPGSVREKIGLTKWGAGAKEQKIVFDTLTDEIKVSIIRGCLSNQLIKTYTEFDHFAICEYVKQHNPTEYASIDAKHSEVMNKRIARLDERISEADKHIQDEKNKEEVPATEVIVEDLGGTE